MCPQVAEVKQDTSLLLEKSPKAKRGKETPVYSCLPDLRYPVASSRLAKPSWKPAGTGLWGDTASRWSVFRACSLNYCKTTSPFYSPTNVPHPITAAWWCCDHPGLVMRDLKVPGWVAGPSWECPPDCSESSMTWSAVSTLGLSFQNPIWKYDREMVGLQGRNVLS